MNSQRDMFVDVGSFQPRTGSADAMPHTPYQAKSVTSKAAAKKAAVTGPTLKRNILYALVAAGANGMTRKEIADAVAGGHQNRITSSVYALIAEKKVMECWTSRIGPAGIIRSPVERDGSVVCIATVGMLVGGAK